MISIVHFAPLVVLVICENPLLYIPIGGICYLPQDRTASQRCDAQFLNASQSLFPESNYSSIKPINPFGSGPLSTTQIFSQLPDTLDNILHFYSNINSINNKIAQKNYSFISIHNNMILCQLDNEPLCSNLSNKIGPSSHPLRAFAPIAINTDFNLNNITFKMDNLADDIYITIHILSVFNSSLHPDFDSIVENHFFPNSVVAGTTSWDVFPMDTSNLSYQYMIGVFAFGYNRSDLDSLYKDFGMAQNWSSKYKQYYFSPSNDTIIYLYGINIICGTEETCDQYLNGITTNITTTEIPIISGSNIWFIISIVFISLFCVNMVIIVLIIAAICKPSIS